MYPSLLKSYKNMFPFKIGTTSFIYPDHYVPNVKMLAPYVDEVELILFDSSYDDFPTTHSVMELALIADEHSLTYNIHLPTDVSISSHDALEAEKAVEAVLHVNELTSSLTPSTYTLHIPYDEKDMRIETVKQWEERVYNKVGKLIDHGINSRDISVETLDYPFEILDNIIDRLDLSVCIDIGHLMVRGDDCVEIFNKYMNRVTIIHLHGVEGKKDHVALDRMSKERFSQIQDILGSFSGVVSLELFSYSHLKASINYLEQKLLGR